MDDRQFIEELNKRAEEYSLKLQREYAAKELEKIKKELNIKSSAYSLTDNFENDIVISVIKVSDMEKILDNHISELKGEQNESLEV